MLFLLQEKKNLSVSECLYWHTVFSSDGTELLVSGMDNAFQLWDTRLKQCINTYNGHTGWVRAACFLNNNNMIASASNDQTIKIWDKQTNKCLKTFQGHTGYVTSVCSLHNNNNKLASASYDKTIRVWNYDHDDNNNDDDKKDSSSPIKILTGHLDIVTSVTYIQGCKKLASACYDKTIKVWDVEQGTCLVTLYGHNNFIRHLVPIPIPIPTIQEYKDGYPLYTIASASDDQTIKLWDIENGTCINTYIGHTDSVSCVAFFLDKNDNKIYLMSASYDKTIKVWGIENGTTCLETFMYHQQRIRSISIHYKEKESLLNIASVSDDTSIKLSTFHTSPK